MKRISFTISLFFSILTAFAAEISGTLPVIYINIDGGAEVTTKETYLSATYYVDPMGIVGVEAIGSVDAQLPLQIKGRGNYTWTGFEKKPYKLKLAQKTALLGMNKSKQFVLLAHADDNKGFLRNAVGLELSRMIGLQWTPGDVPCELVINGSYRGLYFLTENIKIDKARVNITEQEDNATENVSGGWLVEIDNYDSDPHVEVTEGDGSRIIFTYKSPEVLSSAQEEYLKSQMEKINSLVYSNDKNNCEWAEYVDLEELAKFYIVNELVDNYESFHGSCYLHKDLGDNEKWYFGPVWDFGSSFNYNKTQPLYSGREYHSTWIAEMCKFPAFMDVVKSVWQNFYANGYDKIYDYIDSYTAHITAAAKQDLLRWPSYGNNNMSQRAGEVKSKLRTAAKYLCGQWGPEQETTDKITVYFKDDEINPWAEVYIYSWDPEKGNKAYFGGWPGTKMTLITYEGAPVWSFSASLDEEPSASTGLIFGNGGSGVPDNQTADLILVNNKIYDRNGVVGDIAGVSSVEADEDAPIEYFDLYGRKVVTSISGIYVCKQGSKIWKQIVR